MIKKKQPKKKKRLRLRIKVVFKILIFIALVASFIFYIFNLNINNIYITGTNQVKDITIIEKLNIKDYPRIYKLNLKKMEEELKTLPLIKNAKVKRNIFGKLTIKIEETNILFYYQYNNKYITSTNVSIEEQPEYIGYPTLVNFTPDTIFDDLVEGLNKIDYNIVKMINEIEYTPYKAQDGSIIDNNLFTVLMNDGNTVMIDTVNMKNLNKYTTIYASLGMDNVKGVIYLDTIIDEKLLFKSYEAIEKEKQEQTEKEDKQNNKKE